MSEAEGKHGFFTVANVAGIITVSGLVSQALACMIANSFYSRYSLSLDQVGITPLNALTRMYQTSLIAFVSILCIVFLVCIAAWFFQMPRLRRATRRRLALALLGIATVGVIQLTFTIDGAGQRAAKITQSDVVLDPHAALHIRAIGADLMPRPAQVRWLKAEEFPFPPTAEQMMTPRTRSGRVIAINGGQLFYFDLAARQTVSVPAPQVQVLYTSLGA